MSDRREGFDGIGGGGGAESDLRQRQPPRHQGVAQRTGVGSGVGMRHATTGTIFNSPILFNVSDNTSGMTLSAGRLLFP